MLSAMSSAHFLRGSSPWQEVSYSGSNKLLQSVLRWVSSLVLMTFPYVPDLAGATARQGEKQQSHKEQCLGAVGVIEVDDSGCEDLCNSGGSVVPLKCRGGG